MTPDSPKKRESHDAPARPDPRLGEGVRTQGRLTKDLPENEREAPIVGNPNPPYDVVGVDALSPLLEHVEFPATRDEIAERIGHYHVPVDSQTTSPVRSIIDQVAPTRFASSDEVEAALSQAWDGIAFREGRGGRHQRPDYTHERPRED